MNVVQSDNNSEKRKAEWFTRVLEKFISEGFTRILIVAGVLVIVLGLLLFSWKGNLFHFGTSIDNDRVGQFGDFIGGIAGSLWALAGVILFYIALVDQRKEFKKNVEFLKGQKEELEVNRLMTMVYKQIDRIDKKTELFEYKEMATFDSWQKLNEWLDDVRGDYDSVSSSLVAISTELYSIFSVILQSQEIILAATQNEKLQDNLLALLSGNLDTTLAKMARNIVLFYEEYKSQEFRNPHTAEANELRKPSIKRLVDTIQKIRFLAVPLE